jgi:hypothetical protein
MSVSPQAGAMAGWPGPFPVLAARARKGIREGRDNIPGRWLSQPQKASRASGLLGTPPKWGKVAWKGYGRLGGASSGGPARARQARRNTLAEHVSSVYTVGGVEGRELRTDFVNIPKGFHTPLEVDYDLYERRMAAAREAARQGLYRRAVEEALEAWPFIDGMMQYARKYKQEEFDTIPAIDLVLQYAPLLLDFRQLDRLGALLKECRRIERDTEADVGEQLATARARMWAAHRLWDYIEQHPDVRQAELRSALGGQQQDWVDILTTWEEMGLLRRTRDSGTYRLALSTRMGEVISAKCPECGAVAEAPKAMLLDALRCAECSKHVVFVLIG